MKFSKKYIALFSLGLSASVFAFNEPDNYTKESAILLDQLQDHIRATLLAVSNNEIKAGRDMKKFHYSISLPAQQLVNLGLIIDLEQSDDFFKVLTVTSGSMADKLSIKSGDHLLSINDIKITKASKTKIMQDLLNLLPDEDLKLALRSDRTTYREVSTKVKGQYVPEIKLQLGSDYSFDDPQVTSTSESCGEVSVFFSPPLTERFYPASIFNIDDNNVIRDRKTFKLSPGIHKIYMFNHDGDLTNMNNSSSGKGLELDIKANMTYHLAAKFNSTERFSKKDQRNWTPVLWKITERDCSL